MLLKLIIASSCLCLSYSLPTIDPGVFVLQGVPSCRQGKGYCVLGTNCSIDKDFEFDKNGGHCDEVTKSFTSLLSFVCCRFVRDRQDEDEYHTTILPFTIMEEKFQVLDQNPIPIEEYDTEISEDEDIENLVDIVGVVTDSTGIISLVTRPYQPPVKSSTTSTTTSTISSTEVSSTSDENLGVSPEASTSAQPSLFTWGAAIDFINNETSTHTNTAQESVEQPVSVSSSSESSLNEKVHFLSSTIQEKSTLESVENQKPNVNAAANAADIKLNISALDNDHKVISIDYSVSSTRPSNLVTPSSSDTITTTTDLIFDNLTINNSFVKQSIETLKSQLTAQNNSTITSSATTTTIANILENSKDVLFEESRNSPEEPYIDPNIINQILPTLLSSEVPSSQKSTTTETLFQFTSLPPKTSIKEMINNQDIGIETSTSSQKLFNNDLFQGKEQQENNKKSDEIKQSETNKNQLKNQVQVLNLPEEIRSYLLRKQAEKKQNTERIKLPNNTKKDKIENSENNTTSTSFIEPVGNKVEDNMTSTTPNSVTENILQTEKYSGLKKGSNPLVPILLKKNNTESVTKGQENKMVTTAFLYNEENGQTWTGHNEFTTIKTPLLQKYNGPDIIELGNKMRENEEDEMEENVLPHPINLNICGLKSPNLMLSEQARAASTYDWCWSAALMRKEGRIDRFECSGTLVELDLVVTTAACLKRLRSKDLSNYRVVVGDSNLRDELPYGVQYLDIDEIVTHPDYLTSAGAHANDIGIIRLRDVATIDHNVCLACVAQRNAFIPSHTCVVSGYTLGNIPQDIKRDVEGFTPMEGILRESLVTLQKPSDCQSSIRKLSPNPLLLADPKSFICDVKRKSARSCTNTLDGGSPLVCEVGGRWFLAGIASWSRDCSSDPNIYTRVSSFSDWFLNTRLRMYGFVSHRL